MVIVLPVHRIISLIYPLVTTEASTTSRIWSSLLPFRGGVLDAHIPRLSCVLFRADGADLYNAYEPCCEAVFCGYPAHLLDGITFRYRPTSRLISGSARNTVDVSSSITTLFISVCSEAFSNSSIGGSSAASGSSIPLSR